ncbi:MAG: DnaD domain protein [Clostridia bacterium]|nr:DnaD domain protein [Clostridia bacterium]
MECTFDFNVWNDTFAIPKIVVDKYLKDSAEKDIKILIYILKNLSGDMYLSKAVYDLGYSGEEIKESINLWQERKIVPKGIVFEDSKVKTGAPLQQLEKKTEYRYIRPNMNYVVSRTKASENVKWLMQEAEIILGRPLSGGDSASLLMLHDNEGLPIDVIIMLIQYAVDAGKSGMKYIYKIGENWSKEGIDGISKAEKKIKELNNLKNSWRKFENLIGIDHRLPTSREESAVMRWFNEFHFNEELIKEAYDRCVNANGKYILNYMDSIIKRWHKEGIRTLEQANSENLGRAKYRKSNFKKENASYNIDEYENSDILENFIKE